LTEAIRASASPVTRIPFNRPFVAGREFTYIQQAIDAMHLSGDGAFTKRAHAALVSMTGGKEALLTTSCTHALELMALLLDVGPDDEIILPSFTFVSTANAFVLRGARPIFADSRPDTLNVDEERLGELITSRTKAIIVVHYAGVACEMDPIVRLAVDRGVTLLEDNAHGLLGAYRGRALGSFGALAAQSFHETKNFICGEGGALIVNDLQYITRAEVLREKGTNRTQFFRGLIDKYTWIDVGSSYLPSEILAAFLVAQLECADVIQTARKRIWMAYRDGLCDWASSVGATLPVIPDHCSQSFHLFYVMLRSLEFRTRLMAHLQAKDIHAAFHYVPLHVSPMGRRFGGVPGSCPVAERAGACLLRLPFYTGMTSGEQDRVIEAIRAFH
jgi:dTDP-4-amino-4,6-dideoxygalactose transaminase